MRASRAVAHAPFAHAVQDRDQGAASFRQAVLHLGRDLRVFLPVDQPVRFQFFQVGAQRFVGDGFEVLFQFVEPHDLEQTGFNYTMSLIQGKYKMFILYALMEYKVVRFNELKKYIRTISYKTLSATLKELEADGLVHREEYPQIPPKVEYSLTERGRSLIPILDSMCDWGDKHRA